MQLFNGDCLEKMKDIPDGSVDLTVTSPPYDNLRTYNGNNKLWGEHVWKSVIKELYRVTKQGGVVVWVVGDATIKGSETGTSFKQALYFKEVGFNLHDTMIWNKGSFANPSTNRFHQVFEYMFILSKGKIKTYHEILDRNNKYLGIRGASGRDKNGNRKTGTSEVNREYGNRFNIWCISVGGGQSYIGKVEHPAIFPEKLAHDHIISWSNEGDTVFDPFMGSGTTGKMAKLLKRDFIGIELDPEYFKIAEERINAHIISYGSK
jgi:site-specific DNA-methyltransferase (adenine-specific)